MKRVWTKNYESPFDVVEWTTSHVVVKNYKTGKTIYENDVEHPKSWSANAVETCSSKYFRRADIPQIGGEHSVKQLAKRIASCLRKHGESRGYFREDGHAQIFEDEIIAGFITQRIGFNSPVNFNYGLHSEYGVTGSVRERYYYDHALNEVVMIKDELIRPSGAACYLSEVKDSLFDEDDLGMQDLLANQTKIFLTGAGDGVNVSTIRGTGEPISGGGVSSGLIPYLEVRDSNSGYIRSGGKTRRSATMIVCDIDHPDIEAFIDWKNKEEKKAWSLIDNGYESGMEGEAYKTVSGQNSNNSTRISDAFMKALEENSDWYLLSRVDGNKFSDNKNHEISKSIQVPQGKLFLDEHGNAFLLQKEGENFPRRVMKTIKVRDLWNKICHSAWVCGDPGVQFDDVINSWNTVPQYGKINTSNPCSEIHQPDNTTCNLASINLIKFFKDLQNPDWDGFNHACRILTIALDIVVDLSSYPTKQHAIGSAMIRAIGLNHGNIGAVLMRNGIAYDSKDGRYWMSIISSNMTLQSALMSADLASYLGPYKVYNKDNHSKVFKKHEEAISKEDSVFFGNKFAKSLSRNWSKLISSMEDGSCSMRNSFLTSMVPQGTIGLVLDQDTLGCEPDFSLVKYKKLIGGSHMIITNQSVQPALEKLGYSEDTIKKAEDYIRENSTLEGFAGIKEEHLSVFDTAVKPSNKVNLEGLILDEETKNEIALAVSASNSLEELEKNLPVGVSLNAVKNRVKFFNRVISVEAHIAALAAIQGNISQGISKTVNMNSTATEEDISNSYILAHKLGVKCVAIYRDGCKRDQPLNTSASSNVSKIKQIQNGPIDNNISGKWDKTKWPASHRKTPRYTSNSDLFNFTIHQAGANQNVYVSLGLYPESNDIMSIFVNTGRQGETINGLVHSLARVISVALQHGVPPEQIGKKLEGMNFPPFGFLGDSSVFGIRKASSISDLIGRLLQNLPEFYRSGRSEDVLYPKVSFNMSISPELKTESVDQKISDNTNGDTKISNEMEAQSYGFSGAQCTNCASWKTTGSKKCFVCVECGYSNGGCSS